MAVPKRKVSKHKVRMRKASHKTTMATATTCPECGGARESHRVCPSCGSYGGKQVITVKSE